VATEPVAGCIGCDVIAGKVRPPGGIVWRGERFVEKDARPLEEIESARTGPLCQP
jgi:hypothetical protein